MNVIKNQTEVKMYAQALSMKNKSNVFIYTDAFGNFREGREPKNVIDLKCLFYVGGAGNN